jgi:hypothetical protein
MDLTLPHRTLVINCHTSRPAVIPTKEESPSARVGTPPGFLTTFGMTTARIVRQENFEADGRQTTWLENQSAIAGDPTNPDGGRCPHSGR